MKCALCQSEFEGGEGCRSCGLISHCALIRCPHCGYEFVEKSRIVSFLGRLVRHRNGERKGTVQNEAVRPLSEVPLKVSHAVSLVGEEFRNRLTSLGIYPGIRVIVLQRRPSFVVQAGETEVALDGAVASQIMLQAKKAFEEDKE